MDKISLNVKGNKDCWKIQKDNTKKTLDTTKVLH